MNRKQIIIISVVIIAIILVVTNQDKKIDWAPTYNEEKTNPLDTKVFFEVLPQWFSAKPKKIRKTFYEYSPNLEQKDSIGDFNFNYVNISKSYNIDESSFNALLDFISLGNTALIASEGFPYFVRDTLGFETQPGVDDFAAKEINLELNFANESYTYTPKSGFSSTQIKDTLNIKALGYREVESKEEYIEQINFAGIPYGKGVFYIHTNPEIFTNYQMLKMDILDRNYLNTIMSYLPRESPIYFNKIDKNNYEISNSPLRYIMSKKPLKWAWYLLILGILLFMLFAGKRRQRIIPEIPKVKNTTTEFVHSVSNLHFEAKDFDGAIGKTITYFLEHVRSKYYLATNNLDERFIKQLALKTGKPKEQIEHLVTLLIRMKNRRNSTSEDLIKLNKELEKFYSK